MIVKCPGCNSPLLECRECGDFYPLNGECQTCLDEDGRLSEMDKFWREEDERRQYGDAED